MTFDITPFLINTKTPEQAAQAAEIINAHLIEALGEEDCASLLAKLNRDQPYDSKLLYAMAVGIASSAARDKAISIVMLEHVSDGFIRAIAPWDDLPNSRSVELRGFKDGSIQIKFKSVLESDQDKLPDLIRYRPHNNANGDVVVPNSDAAAIIRSIIAWLARNP